MTMIIPRSVGVVIPTSPCAKVCNAYSYQTAQRSRGLDRIHRDAVFSRLSLDTSPIRKSLCLSIESTVLSSFAGERSVGDLDLQTLAHGEGANDR